jgi:hypothetical protein
MGEVVHVSMSARDRNGNQVYHGVMWAVERIELRCCVRPPRANSLWVRTYVCAHSQNDLRASFRLYWGMPTIRTVRR